MALAVDWDIKHPFKQTKQEGTKNTDCDKNETKLIPRSFTCLDNAQTYYYLSMPKEYKTKCRILFLC